VVAGCSVDRWAATADRTAPTGPAKAAKNELPSVLTSTPPPSRVARRRMAACSSPHAISMGSEAASVEQVAKPRDG
jgi:hypothetical protein